MSRSLDDAFDMEREKIIDGDIGVDIPSDPEEQNLTLIIRLSLQAYESLMETASFMEPKDRIKQFEIGERYLNQAKDARVKKERLEIDRMKASSQTNKSTNTTKTDNDESDESAQEDTSGLTRGELLEKSKRERLKMVK